MPPMRRTNIGRRTRNARNIIEFRRAHNTQAPAAQTLSQVKINDKKKERQQRYREQNREKLKQREAKRRQRQLNSKIIAEPSSNINRIELNDKEITDANSRSSFDLEETLTSSIKENNQAEVKNAIPKKKECQQKYKEQKKKKLKQCETERRQCQQNSEINSEPSSNINRIELNDKEITDSNFQSSSGLEETQTSSVQENNQVEIKNAIPKKKQRQQRYREKNREKLKQREAERRQRQLNSKLIAESSTSSNIDCIEIISEPIMDDEISTNAPSVDGLEETQNLFVEISECWGPECKFCKR